MIDYTLPTHSAATIPSSNTKEAIMIGGNYKNVVLVSGVIVAFFLFMAFTWFYVIGDINQGRSCVRTCDTPMTTIKK